MSFLLSPPVAFLVMLALAWGIMGFAKSIAPQSRPENGKYKHYACGEDVEMKPIQPNYSGFFVIAFAYSVIHISALTVMTVPSSGVWMGLGYLAVVFLAVLAFISELKLV